MSALMAPVPLYEQAEGVWKRRSDVRERVETIYSHDAMKARKEGTERHKILQSPDTYLRVPKE